MTKWAYRARCMNRGEVKSLAIKRVGGWAREEMGRCHCASDPQSSLSRKCVAGSWHAGYGTLGMRSNSHKKRHDPTYLFWATPILTFTARSLPALAQSGLRTE